MGTVLGKPLAQVLVNDDSAPLNRLVAAASSARDMDELLRILLPRLDAMLPCESLGFFWHEPGVGLVLRVVAATGVETGVEHVQMQAGIGSLQGFRKPSCSQSNTSSDNPALRWLGLYGLCSSLVVPVVVGRELQGCLVASRKAPNSVDPGELNLLNAAARMLGPMMGYAILRERLGVAHKEMASIKDELTRSERLKLQVEAAYGVAHDVNNILGLIAVRVDLLRLQPIPTPIMASVEAIQQAVEDGVAGIRRITQFAREQQTQPFAPVVVDNVLADALEMTRPRWQDPKRTAENPVRVRLEHGPGSTVMGIASELREVIVNMILNALNAMRSGGDLVLSSDQEGEWAVLCLSDTGSGMTEGIRQRIFEPFFTTGDGAGRGLGLWVSHRIVARHGGDISVESTPSKGTTFRIRLPLAPMSASSGAGHPSCRQGSILIVDDEVGLAEALRLGLEASGYQVSASGNPREALKMFVSARHDLVITDIRMPGMTGWELAAEIKRISPTTPVVAMTGWPVHRVSEGEHAEYFDTVLQKPCRLRDLEALARRLLGSPITRPAGRP